MCISISGSIPLQNPSETIGIYRSPGGSPRAAHAAPATLTIRVQVSGWNEKYKRIRQEAHVYLEVCRAIERAAIHRTSCEHPLEHGLPCRPQEKTAPSKARRNQKSVELTTCHASGLERMSAVPPDSAELKRQRGRRRRQQRGGDKEEENNESM
ncbi:unnamed protein product [Prorocentrum cordatum]|uniref:Uncharacterized protein n=1 Tax=Prorocentrum cordatum TaxID=2364126 RepID=A0ABN9XV76_9DINO|nr:unnamed protein product [Polarella glacialis]